ncbi:MAG: hypothetical protein FWD26_01420 [Treponema sp.]|nr:hypothetical protein [Treponema sp.]
MIFTRTGLNFCIWLILFFLAASGLSAQNRGDDSDVALQYVNWVRQAIEEGRLDEAYAGINRAKDFADVSSDISYLLAFLQSSHRSLVSRNDIVNNLNNAIETNRWVIYNETNALLLKAQMLIAMREYLNALECLNRITVINADSAMLRLLALRGMVFRSSDHHALAQFRSFLLNTMDRYPRDPRPLRIFFEYAQNRKPFHESDINLLELALRRLPFLLEADPELAWMASPFIRDTETARRYVASYRAGGIPHVRNRDFYPHPGSIAAALNLGLLGDIEAADELFSASRGFNYPYPREITPNGNPVLDKDIIEDIYNLLRSEEGREYFTRKLLSFTGFISTDNDRDGYIESSVFFNEGSPEQFVYYMSQNNVYNFIINFSRAPQKASVYIAGIKSELEWERYPSVGQVTMDKEIFKFRPADFQYAPVSFIVLGGSRNRAGLSFPVPAYQYVDLTYRTLVSYCSSLSRPSVEFDGATETFYMERGIPLLAVETLNGKQLSVTEFQRGLPVIQHIDLDMDGRMETIRRFRSLDVVAAGGIDFLDYRSLIVSSESDWSGDGKHKTKEMYLPDGSVVYLWDMDSSGEMNYSQTGR